MAINFDALPQDRPASGNLLAVGFYKAKVVKAEMKTPKNGGTDYLELTLDLTDGNGKACGKFWERLFDSDKDLIRYKLMRFLYAIDADLAGSTFELKDLAKIVPNKEFIIDIGLDEKNERGPRNQTEVFKNEIFYRKNEWAALHGGAEIAAADAADADLPFNMNPEDDEY